MKLHLYSGFQVGVQAEFISFTCAAFFFFKPGENPQSKQTAFVKFWKDTATGNEEMGGKMNKCFQANATFFKMKNNGKGFHM